MKQLMTWVLTALSGWLVASAPLLAIGAGSGAGGFHAGSIGNAGHVNYPAYYPGGYTTWGYEFGSTTFEGDGDLGGGYGDPGAPTAYTGTGGGPPEPLQDHQGVYVPRRLGSASGPSFDNDWWAQDPRASGAEVAVPTAGSTVPSLPAGSATIYAAGSPYFYRDGIFYQPAESGYRVVEPPVGITVPRLPNTAQIEQVGNQQFVVYNEVYYQALYGGNGVVYRVVEDPRP